MNQRANRAAGGRRTRPPTSSCTSTAAPGAILGEVTTEGHVDEIQVRTWNWGVSAGSAIGSGARPRAARTSICGRQGHRPRVDLADGALANNDGPARSRADDAQGRRRGARLLPHDAGQRPRRRRRHGARRDRPAHRARHLRLHASINVAYTPQQGAGARRRRQPSSKTKSCRAERHEHGCPRTHRRRRSAGRARDAAEAGARARRRRQAAHLPVPAAVRARPVGARAHASSTSCGEMDAVDAGRWARPTAKRCSCELLREAVFAGKTTPMVFGQPRPGSRC